MLQARRIARQMSEARGEEGARPESCAGADTGDGSARSRPRGRRTCTRCAVHPLAPPLSKANPRTLCVAVPPAPGDWCLVLWHLRVCSCARTRTEVRS
eukprot:1002594-Rhodomonas_salina.4